jgi:hypothetical protein
MTSSSAKSAPQPNSSLLPIRYSLLPTSFSLLPRDALVSALLFIIGLVAYVSTLAPTLLDGDAALFQYTPWVLGVTYPTGYPTYILLGRLWTTLVGFGSVAYRMNLFSAVCGALALAILYPTVRRLLESRLAALLAVLIFATLPTYWRWATEAKIYTLHILLLSGILFLLTHCLEVEERRNGGTGTRGLGESENQGIRKLGSQGSKEAEGRASRPATVWKQTGHLVLAAVLFGLALGNHSTTILLAPGLFLFFWLNCRPSKELSENNSSALSVNDKHEVQSYLRTKPNTLRSTLHPPRFTFYALRFTLHLLPIIVLPLVLYLYIPLRAERLLAREGTLTGLTVPVAVAQGLVSDFYHSGLGGLVRYFTAADFTGGVVTNWGQVPRQLIITYWPLVRDDFSLWDTALGIVGAVYFAVWRPRRFWPLLLMYATLIPFVLTYGQGEQSAFLLPSSLIWAIFCGAAVAGGLRLISGIRDQGPEIRNRAVYSAFSVFLTLVLVGVVVWLPVQQARNNVDWLTDKWDTSVYQYWTDVLAHPMEPGAGVLAHWGDLTSFWYMQHVERSRPDLYGLYPPSEEVVLEWLGAGHPLYIAGPLQGWADGVETRYQLLPWGRVVRLAPRSADPLALLPNLPDAPDDPVFNGRIRLLKVGAQDRAPSGGVLPVSLVWQTTAPLPVDTHVSLRLVEADGAIAAQTDDTLVSGWLPADLLPSGQVLLSHHHFELPAGLLPGEYHLQLALFQPHVGGWPLTEGRFTQDLGPVRVTPAHPSGPLDPWAEYKPLRGVDFGGEIGLVGYDYSVTRAGQGKGFAAEFLWQAKRLPSADYTLVVELVDEQGKVWRNWRHVPTNGRAPTGTWANGQLVRDQVALVLPADAPPGEDTLRVRLAWERSDGTRLPAWRGPLPVGDSITLPGVRVVEKENRLFEPPPTAYTANANFDDKIQLLGYDMLTPSLSPGDTLPLTLLWGSLTSDMRESYTVFVHLVGPDGVIHGQWDKEPGERSKQPTTGWVAGEVVIDPISVPLASDAPTGIYQVLVGFYLAPDGPRLPLRDESGNVIGDALELTRLKVNE